MIADITALWIHKDVPASKTPLCSWDSPAALQAAMMYIPLELSNIKLVAAQLPLADLCEVFDFPRELAEQITRLAACTTQARFQPQPWMPGLYFGQQNCTV